MSMIKKLDKNTAEQIAAGEVIENPASVVKELVENAIDAGADRVEVNIESGGIKSIVVTDNGRGMEREELPLAFKRFATSKLRILDDLEKLSSLGFRGEALPSIAAVSRVRLVSRPEKAPAGAVIHISGGMVEKNEETGAPPGTRVEVTDLFYNTPGRFKFLRAGSAESARISTLLSEMALANPNVAFTLKSGKKTLFSSPGDGVLLHAIGAVYGAETAESMLALQRKESLSGAGVGGFISAAHLTRSSRRWITLTVNGRLVKDAMIVNALERGYGDYLPSKRHPLAVLNLKLDPSTIDVNVHPAKVEIRFQEPQEIKGLVYRATKLALDTNAGFFRPAEKVTDPDHENDPGSGKTAGYRQTAWSPQVLFERPEPGEYLASSAENESGPPGADKQILPGFPRPRVPLPGEAPGSEKPEPGRMRLIGQFLQSYLVVQNGEDMLLVDQHAAHERINYHRLKERKSAPNNEDSQLIIPLDLDLPDRWNERLPLFIPLLEKAGFKLEEVSGGRYRVCAVPFNFKKQNENHEIYDLLEELLGDDINDMTSSAAQSDTRDRVLKTIACYQSIKAGQNLAREEMDSLLREWEQTPRAFYCPHGRPVVISFKRYDLERCFYRS